MTRHFFSATILVLLFTSLVSAADNGADINWRGSGGWGVGLPYAAQFDPTSLRQLSGEVVAVNKITPVHGMTEGIAITVRTHNETVIVHLGPLWFLERQDALRFIPGDSLGVTGSQTTVQGEKVLIATAITRKGKQLLLRDTQGIPLWSSLRQP